LKSIMALSVLHPSDRPMLLLGLSSQAFTAVTLQGLRLPGDFEGMLGRNFFEHHVVCLDYKLREIRVR
jgi:hypothetical protein